MERITKQLSTAELIESIRDDLYRQVQSSRARGVGRTAVVPFAPPGQTRSYHRAFLGLAAEIESNPADNLEVELVYLHFDDNTRIAMGISVIHDPELL